MRNDNVSFISEAAWTSSNKIYGTVTTRVIKDYETNGFGKNGEIYV